MEQLIQQSTKRYRFWFILSAVVVVALGLLCRFHIIPSLSLFADKISNSLQSIIMMAILLLIPVTLSVFRRKSLKWQQMEEPADRVKAYAKAALIRLMIFNALALLSVLMYLFISPANALTLLMMTAVFYLFILPNKMQMCRELGLNPDGSIYVEESEPEVEKVGDFIVMEEDEDDFIPRKRQKQEDEDPFEL
ncbi:MAG: hypothetical protein J6V49_08145 [Bacteroidales bacterium]|nr:hypothetical protein [Bacteroidales bacterium]MBO7184089.1 hypothetical protein [Bacteroidales bacterium]MBO7232687.1 hypothetical protein [Bacteroidales bacterium]MBO7324303.1 hypothetical protein [Bacteroidales bacterium]